MWFFPSATREMHSFRCGWSRLATMPPPSFGLIPARSCLRNRASIFHAASSADLDYSLCQRHIKPEPQFSGAQFVSRVEASAQHTFARATPSSTIAHRTSPKRQPAFALVARHDFSDQECRIPEPLQQSASALDSKLLRFLPFQYSRQIPAKTLVDIARRRI